MKKLYVPGKVWLNIEGFVKDFPQAKTSLIVLLADSMGLLTSKDSFTYDKEIQTHRNAVEYVLDPANPLTINFSPDSFDLIGQKIVKAISSANINDICKRFIKPGFYYSFGIQTMTSFNSLISKILISTIAEWYTSSSIKSKVLSELSKIDIQNQLPMILNCLKTYKPAIIDLLVSIAFKHFEARTPSAYKNFKEIYGVSDVNQVPADTISYVITGKEPPLPKKLKQVIDVKSVGFWSDIFSHPASIGILSAVVRNLPVKYKTLVTNWKDPNQALTGVNIQETDSEIKYIFTYVFQDFEIEVGPSNNVVVKYNRGTDTAEVIRRKKAAWKKWVKIISVIAAGAVITVAALGAAGVIGGTAASSGATAGTAGTTAGTSTAVSSGVSTDITAALSSGGASAGWSTSAPLMQAITQGSSMYAPAASWGAAGSALAAGGSATLVSTSAGTMTTSTAGSLWGSAVSKAPALLSAALKAGVGIWGASEKAKIQEEMMKMGLDPSGVPLPDGMLPDGTPLFRKAGVFNFTTLALMMGAGAILYLFYKDKK